MLSTFNKPVRFDEFMQFALYHPQHGYYARGERVFGREGDFVTAPELSPFFGQTIGMALREALTLCGGVVYEFGAGTGQLACDVLHTAGDLISQYNIIDVSAGLKPVQLARLTEQHGEEIAHKVRWLSALPDELKGVVLGNEILDATPVRRFRWHHNGPLEGWVHNENDAQTLQWIWKPADADFANAIEELHAAHGPWPDGYESEIAEQSTAWVSTITERLSGLALMVDYGYHAAQYYLPTRTKGTLRATSRHTAHDDFLVNIGKQDLTAHVNFSAVYQALERCGGALEGYSHQGEFLLAHGILDLAQQQADLTHPVRGALMRQNLNTLLNEADMGEAFKVICWSKGIDLEGTALNQAFLNNDRSSDL